MRVLSLLGVLEFRSLDSKVRKCALAFDSVVESALFAQIFYDFIKAGHFTPLESVDLSHIIQHNRSAVRPILRYFFMLSFAELNARMACVYSFGYRG